MDGSIALVEFSKPSRRACVKTFEYAHIEVGLKIWFRHRRGTVLWPTDQLEAAVLDLFDNATAAAAFTATVLATLADAPELREQVARDGVL